MKNIEKYKNTKDALEAYYNLDFKKVPFDIWLECEYEGHIVKTLLDAAEALKETWYKEFPNGKILDVVKDIGELADAVEREKRKPVRNFDKYETEDEAYASFIRFCDKQVCSECRFRDMEDDIRCAISWLYSEA